ncbi:M48 family metalloprotease [Polaromonas sp. SM01]|uniref:M48 family metalloprotease n=1 Tax=Polaromonas sp. SM01 TaxID=3085630 RepID=UPI00298230E2|nr:M48 family metalloprotease [Polaromonas sp. SM01]MDW5441073.1 M48 family metalloprotease [Polaromonas sp. SM01]
MASANLSQAQTPVRPSGALPALGDTSELAVSAERRLGDRIATSIYRDPDYLDDPVLGDYLLSIWRPLMVAARARGELGPELEERFAWDIMQIRNRTINAFALPGGYLGVHLGLISAVETRDELASVLAHELSHVTQRHISRLMSKQSQQMPWLIAAMILGALAASKNPDAAMATIAGGQAMAVQNQLNFSRDMEREADRVGFGVMADAGFDKQGFASMFDKLQQASRLNDNGSYPYLRSHPLTTERIGDAKGRLQLDAGNAAAATAPTAAQAANARVVHAMMAARARVLGDSSVDGLRTQLAEAQRVSLPAGAALSPRDAGALYGGALAASQKRDYTLARSLAAKLKSATTSNPSAAEIAEWLALEVELASGNTAGLAPLANTGSRAAVWLQSRADLAAGRAQDASNRLQSWVASHPKDAMAWQLLATAYGKEGQTLRAIRADAESRVAQLDYGAARDRFKAAQDWLRSNRDNSGAGSHIDASIIDTRAREIDQLLREQALQERVDR